MTQQRARVDPRADPAVRFAVLEIVRDELDQSAPELAQDLEHRVNYPDQYGGEVIAAIPDGWVIDWRDVARLALEDLEREDPPLVKRVTEPDGELVRFVGRPWPASARRFELTDADERELARLRDDTEDAWDDDENEND
jgi:hypothetical protein